MKSALRTTAGALATGRVNKREAAVLGFSKQVATVLWNFSTDGGAVGTISFRTQLPANAVVTDVWTDEQTAVTAATSITLKAGSTALTAALDMTADAGIQKRALAGAVGGIKLSSSSELNIAIATTAATAGKVRFAVEFYVSP